MKTILVDPFINPATFNNFSVYIHATDTCYGLACAYNNNQGIKRIQQIKKRLSNNPMSLLMTNLKMVQEFCELSSEQTEFILSSRNFNHGLPSRILATSKCQGLILQQKKASSFVLIKKSGKLNSYFPELKTVSVRLENDQFPVKLSSILNTPVITTSANLSGDPVIYQSAKIKHFFSLHSDICFLDSGNISPVEPSAIWDLTNKPYQRLR
jgi:tRNA A37 threonylcarbamoyladenosine synthetase subunit TsaC/SUA5/YrdC